MILFTILTIIAFALFYQNQKKTGINPLFIYIVPLVILALFSIEVLLTDIDFFISDEVEYFNMQATNYYSYLDRIVWYGLNYFEMNFDILPNIALKLINIPILFFFLFYVWKIFDKNNNVFLAVIFIPYLSLIATKDFRDVLILMLTSLTIYLFNYKKKYILALFPLLLLFFTRNFIVFVIIGLWISGYLYQFLKNAFRKIKKIKIVVNTKSLYLKTVSLVIIISVLIIAKPYIGKKYRSYKFRIEYYLSDYHKTRLVKTNAISTGNIFTDYVLGGIRYCFTPIPHSIFKRMLFHGDDKYKYGKTDDFIRGINQIIYYILLLYIIFYYKYFFKAIKNLTKSQKFLLLNLLMYLPIYTFYSFGGGHQRIKIPFQFAIFLIFLITYRYKLFYKKVKFKKLDEKNINDY